MLYILYPSVGLRLHTGLSGAGWMVRAGLIILSAEWAHITKHLLSPASELLQSGNSAQAFFLFFFFPNRRSKKIWVQLNVGGEVQTTTDPVWVSLCVKAGSVSGGWEQRNQRGSDGEPHIYLLASTAVLFVKSHTLTILEQQSNVMIFWNDLRFGLKH